MCSLCAWVYSVPFFGYRIAAWGEILSFYRGCVLRVTRSFAFEYWWDACKQKWHSWFFQMASGGKSLHVLQDSNRLLYSAVLIWRYYFNFQEVKHQYFWNSLRAFCLTLWISLFILTGALGRKNKKARGGLRPPWLRACSQLPRMYDMICVRQ